MQLHLLSSSNNSSNSNLQHWLSSRSSSKMPRQLTNRTLQVLFSRIWTLPNYQTSCNSILLSRYPMPRDSKSKSIRLSNRSYCSNWPPSKLYKLQRCLRCLMIKFSSSLCPYRNPLLLLTQHRQLSCKLKPSSPRLLNNSQFRQFPSRLFLHSLLSRFKSSPLRTQPRPRDGKNPLVPAATPMTTIMTST